MSTELQEYTDEATGIRLTVEYDIPEYPRITVYPPEDCALSTEKAHGAIRRLLAQAGIKPLDEQEKQA